MENNLKLLQQQNQKIIRLCSALFCAAIITVAYVSSFTQTPLAMVVISVYVGLSSALIIYFLSSFIFSKTSLDAGLNQFFPVTDPAGTIKIIVNNDALPRTTISFSEECGIRSQVVQGDNVLIFTKDYRSIRLNKSEVKDFYTSLIESEYTFFKPGNHEIEIKFTKK